LIFLKDSATPVVLYPENPQTIYDEIKRALKGPVSLIEKEGNGPIKKLCVLSTQVQGLALQDVQIT
jgi:hypothetical protein